jgi:1-acyl-sn-glycerol-3-phosphate acyltransferase
MRKTPEPVRRWTWPHYYFGAWLARTVCRLMGGYRVHGREHIPLRGGAIICSNHVSYLDPPVLGAGFTPRRTYFMAKAELFEIPVLGAVIRTVYAFPVDRTTTDREAIRHGIELLQKGELLVVFPEGGRSPDGAIQPGNIGPALMATRAQVPIIPAALKETDRVMPPGKGGLHRGRVQVDYGEPIHPSQFGDGRLDKSHLQAFTDTVMQAIEELQKAQYERVGEVAPPRVKESTDAE